jgi:hypothetical protein
MATTADDDARANLLKGLGVARRRDASASASGDDVDDPAEAEADDAGGDEAGAAAPDDPAKGAVASGLGIRRRKPAAAVPDAADPEAAPAVDGAAAAAPGSGLGIKRRKAPEGGAASAGAEDEAPAPKPRRKLGNDQVSTILANYFRGRPLLELPERVFELKRTHGFYNGDDRPERKLVVGFEPALVLYILPVYPEDIYPTYVPKTYEPIDPGLHRQPKFVADGFIVDQPYNILGESYLYVAFRSDGQPLELPDTSAHVEPVRKTSSLGLGIKRRK